MPDAALRRDGRLGELARRRPKLYRVLATSGWLFGERLVGLALGLPVAAVLARALGPEVFGVYAAALAVVALLTPVAALGLERVVTRELVDHPERAPEILGTAVVLRALGACGAMALVAVALATPAGGGDPRMGVALLLSALLVLGSLEPISWWFQSRLEGAPQVAARSPALVVSSLAKLAAVAAGLGLVAVAAAHVGQYALGSALLALVYARRGGRIGGWRFSRERARALLRESWPVALTALSVMVYMRSDVLMLGLLRGQADAGVYAAVVQVSELWFALPAILIHSAYPAIFEARSLGPDAYASRLRQLFDGTAALGLVLALPTCLLAGPLVSGIFGAEFAAGGPILAVHVWSVVFVCLGMAQGPWNIAEGETRLYLMRAVLGAVTNVGLNLVVIPLWGGMGAAVSTLVAYAVAAWLGNLLHPRTRGMFALQTRALLLGALRDRQRP